GARQARAARARDDLGAHAERRLHLRVPRAVDAGRAPDVRGARPHLTSTGPGRVHVIFNPASGRGRGGRRIPGYLELLRRHLGAFEHSLTAGPGDEARLARAAVEAGATAVVAVGGDGTWGQVAGQVVAAGPGVRFALLPSGT